MTNSKWYLIISLTVLALLPSSYALSCQYTENNTYQIEVQNVYEKGSNSFITNLLEITNFINGGDYGSFEIHNDYNQPISIRLIFDYGYSQSVFHRWKRASVDLNTTIPKHDFYKVQVGPNHEIAKEFTFYNETIQYFFLDNFQTYQKYELVNVTIEECKHCLGKNCSNDGDNCSINPECGGGYCVRGQCNSEPFCYNHDCMCSSSEVQCMDNSSCVQKSTLPLGVKPVCSSLECITAYTDPETGFCAKTPEMLYAEEVERRQVQNAEIIKLQENESARNSFLLVLLSVISIVGLVIFSFFYLKNKRRIEEEKTKQEQEKTKQLNSELEKLKIHARELNQKHSWVGALESEKKEMEKRIARLNSSIGQKKLEHEEIQARANAVAEMPLHFSNLTQQPVFIGPNGYLYFKNNDGSFGKLFHRWIARKHIYQKYPSFFETHYSGIPFSFLEVHHIDNDKTNPQPENLIILTPEQHKLIDSKSYPKCDRKLGLQRLTELKLKAPHIPELR